ncbi:MAG: acyl-[acyl-carrier-protein]--UDP-N-acetylglucosamine O-acyltransferase [Candidatus Melainabacteria bacterium GWF2_37_15]|nr:MAG: acyl-[acyl-carrier-protein]--UDP-N-acetylglucosamine O-acyltransferase [Candidatus Melainabacteria bacterium GWF2_37_15]
MIQESIHETVKIHPYAVIGPEVKIGANCEIFPHTYLEHCEIGENCVISPSAVIGTPPQDLSYKNESTKVIIGNNCKIRENVTINRASGEGNTTELGNDCFIMTGAHIAHNCKVGNNVIIANNALLAGHIQVGDYVFIGGAVVMHQFVRVGEMTIVGGFTGTRLDLPPYAKIDGRPGRVVGINTVGLKRRGLSQDERTLIKKAFNLLWFSELNTQQAVERIRKELPSSRYIDHLIEFMSTSKRGITKLSGKGEDESE